MSSKLDEGWAEEGVMQIEGFILVSVQTLGSNCEAENLPLTVQDKEHQTLLKGVNFYIVTLYGFIIN